MRPNITILALIIATQLGTSLTAPNPDKHPSNSSLQINATTVDPGMLRQVVPKPAESNHSTANLVSFVAVQPAALTVAVSQSQSMDILGVSPSSVVPAPAPAPAPAAKPTIQEQYGQPESTKLPANYKPWGSWGLYIGGNPADGYYTDFYKSLPSNNGKAASSPSELTKAPLSLSSPVQQYPMYKPSVSLPTANFYPFAYSANDFAVNTPVHSQYPSQNQYHYQLESPVSLVQPLSSHTNGMLTIKGGSDKNAIKEVHEAQMTLDKSQQPSYYGMPVVAHSLTTNSLQAPVPQQQLQIVAYPVPIGSQIVGSQVGVDGAFYPYGVHAFTKYALKPTVVTTTGSNSDINPNISGMSKSAPVYNPDQLSGPVPYKTYSTPIQAPSQYYYGYPASQYQYSNGAHVIPSSKGNLY